MRKILNRPYTRYCNIDQGVVRSKIFRGYVQLDGLGETLTIYLPQHGSQMKVWRNERLFCIHARAYMRCSLALGIAHFFWTFSDDISVIWLVDDMFLLDEFDWSIVLWRNRWEALLGFSGQPKSDKNHFLSELYWTPYISAKFCPILFG